MPANKIGHTALRYSLKEVPDPREITALQLPKFKAETTELIGTDGMKALALIWSIILTRGT